MDDNISCLWKSTFGDAWNVLTNEIPGLGGFLVLKTEKSFMADKNALLLLGLAEDAGYDNLLNVLCTARKIGAQAAVRFVLVNDDDKYMSGFVCYEMQHQEYQDARLFSRLVDENLFIYHFQPIVNAHTGEISAYEALMRTDSSIGLNPLQVLDLASKFGRLYDIERATFMNTLSSLKKHRDIFEHRKLFINSITGYMLTDEDYEELHAEFGNVMDRVVVELTEQTQIPDDTLNMLMNRLRVDNMQLAVDDYGTGYSNTSNLLRYNPCVVKIDRSLIAHIENNQKMQKMVTTIVEFLHNSGYIALAEGVETYEEVRCVIGLGVDLLQGFYLAKPEPELLTQLPEDIKNDIHTINMEVGSDVQKFYQPSAHETIALERLVADKYTDILIGVSDVTILGENGQFVAMNIRVKDNTDCTINLKDVWMSSTTAEPVLAIGENCSVLLFCGGVSYFDRKGIQVPCTSSLGIYGDGDLTVSSESKECYGIGNDVKHSHGDVLIDMKGKLVVNVNGEECVGIGSGRNRKERLIQVRRGDLQLECSGGSCVGVGTFSGKTNVSMTEGVCSIKLTSASAVGVGALSGETNISVKNCRVNIEGTGNCQTGLGVLREGTGEILVSNSYMGMNMRGVYLACIGTRNGKLNCSVDNAKMDFYCEGLNTSGVGDLEGSGDVSVENVELNVKLCTNKGIDLGSPSGKLVIKNSIRNSMINP